jgi:hypothetical protein
LTLIREADHTHVSGTRSVTLLAGGEEGGSHTSGSGTKSGSTEGGSGARETTGGLGGIGLSGEVGGSRSSQRSRVAGDSTAFSGRKGRARGGTLGNGRSRVRGRLLDSRSRNVPSLDNLPTDRRVGSGGSLVADGAASSIGGNVNLYALAQTHWEGSGH